MARKRYPPEEIIQHLRTAEIEQSKGLTQAEAARKVGVTPITLSRWKSEFGGAASRPSKAVQGARARNFKTS